MQAQKTSFFLTESPSERKYASSFLYKSKTSVTQIVSLQPTHPTKITLARIACLCFGLVTQRPLSNGGERALRDEAKQWLRRRLQCAWNQCSLGTINQCVRLFQINGKFFFLHLSPLTLSTLTSVSIFSIIFSTRFLWYWQGEIFEQSRASLVGKHFLYSRGLNVWFRDLL